MLINFLVWMLKCAVTLFFCTCFAHKNMENTPSKVEYFSKIAEIFSNAKNGPVCPDIVLKTHIVFQCFLYLVQIFGGALRLAILQIHLISDTFFSMLYFQTNRLVLLRTKPLVLLSNSLKFVKEYSQKFL